MSDIIQACFKCGIKMDHRKMINEGAHKGYLCKPCYLGEPKPKKAVVVEKPKPVAEKPKVAEKAKVVVESQSVKTSKKK